MMILLFFLSSGILEHPALFEIIGMALSGILLIIMMIWTAWIVLSDAGRLVPKYLCILGIIALILLFSVFTIFEDRYDDLMKNKEKTTVNIEETLDISEKTTNNTEKTNINTEISGNNEGFVRDNSE